MQKFKDYLANRRSNMNSIGDFIKRYRIIYLVILSVIALFEVAMIIYMSIRLSERFSTHRVIYLCSYVTLFITSIAMAIVVALSEKKNVRPITLAVLVHIYALIIVAWATTVSSVDLFTGSYPIVYLTIIITLGSVVFIDPIFYGLLSIVSAISLFILSAHAQPDNTTGYYFNIIVFIVMAFIVAYRNYTVSLKEEHRKQYFETLSEYDVLTGLKNENSYYKLVDSICKKIKRGEEVDFTVFMMDVNLLKATNDQYGHHFGAHLIQEAGHAIREIFKESNVFHVGGDEFIVISYDDQDRIPQYIKQFDERLRYTPIIFEDVEIHLSVARGYSKYKNGDTYTKVLERADKAMYKHKKEMKQELGIASIR